MKFLRKLAYRAERGQATLEAVIVLPCILILVLVALEGACMFSSQLSVQNAARTGFAAIEASPEVNTAVIKAAAADSDSSAALTCEKVAKEAICKDTGWDEDAVEVDVMGVGEQLNESYTHQLPSAEGEWMLDADGTPGRKSHVNVQGMRVEVRYQAPAATPIGYLAAAITGGEQAFGSFYHVRGQAAGSLDVTTQESW